MLYVDKRTKNTKCISIRLIKFLFIYSPITEVTDNIKLLSAKSSYPKTTLAFLNTRIQAPSSPHSSGCHELLTVRKTRSGCGIMMATRPLVLERAVMPRAEPFGLAGYTSVGLRLLSMYCATIKFCA